jgi:hypothetical protein
VGGEEAILSSVTDNDACGASANFDNICIGHETATGQAGVPESSVIDDVGECRVTTSAESASTATTIELVRGGRQSGGDIGVHEPISINKEPTNPVVAL